MLCMRCGYAWKNRVEIPRCCPSCHLSPSEKAKAINSLATRDYHRKNTVGTIVDGVFTFVKLSHKRLRPNLCELCHTEGILRLNYHHWDPSNPNKGMYVCTGCHVLAERIEKDPSFIDRYNKLKNEIEQDELSYLSEVLPVEDNIKVTESALVLSSAANAEDN